MVSLRIQPPKDTNTVKILSDAATLKSGEAGSTGASSVMLVGPVEVGGDLLYHFQLPSGATLV